MERRIEGSTKLQSPADRALRVLRDHADPVLEAGTLAAHRHPEIGFGPLHHEISLTVGPAEDGGNRVARRIAWAAAVHRDRYPVFEGEIAVERDDRGAAVLSLHGLYVVPFGTVGRFGDGVGGRRLARRAIAGFLEDLARRVDRAAQPLESHDEPFRYVVEVLDHGAELAFG